MALTKVEAEQLQPAQTSITSVGTLTGLTISGDLTVDTSTLKVDSSNNRVGIGITSPDEILHVKGDGARIYVDSADYNLFSIGRRASSGADLDKAYLRMKSEGTNTIALDTAGASYFNGGDVGIGIASPAAELHVNASSENVNLRLTRDTNYGVQITGTDGATTPVLRLATINNGTLTERIRMSETALSPTTDQEMALGSASNRFNKLFVKTSETQKFRIEGASTTADSSFMMSYFDTTLSGSDTLTADRAQYGIYSALNSSATGGDTSNEHRLYGIRSLVKATGDSDLIYGGYFTGEAEHSSGTVSALYGSFNQAIADPESGGTISNTYGAYNQASINGSAGSTITHAYGSWNRAITGTTDVVAHSSLTGCYAEIETDASGTGRTTTNGYIFRGIYDDDSSAEHKFTNFYGLNLTGTNLTTRVDGTGSVAGVYLDMPGVDQGFWNSEDQPNHFRGSLSIGSGGRQVGDTVGAELHLVEPDGGDLVLARYDATIGTGNSLGKIFFGGTEDSGTTVNFSAAIQAFAQSAHSTTDADGYLSFYTTPQSSTTLEEQLRIDRSGTIKVIRGNIEISAPGQGISFINASDTASGETVSSSVLDDYEEGTFNASIIPQTGSITTGSSDNLCTYTRIGRLVTVQGRIQCSAASNPGGQLYVGDLPFSLYNAGENAFSSAVAVNLYNLASNMGGETVGEMTTTGGARILIRGNGGTTSSVHTAGNKIQANSIIGFTATYPTT